MLCRGNIASVALGERNKMFGKKVVCMRVMMLLALGIGFLFSVGFSIEESGNCDVECGEDEFVNSECECVPLGGGLVSPCCLSAFALVATAGFVLVR